VEAALHAPGFGEEAAGLGALLDGEGWEIGEGEEVVEITVDLVVAAGRERMQRGIRLVVAWKRRRGVGTEELAEERLRVAGAPGVDEGGREVRDESPEGAPIDAYDSSFELDDLMARTKRVAVLALLDEDMREHAQSSAIEGVLFVEVL
jgi:hypothetical protein